MKPGEAKPSIIFLRFDSKKLPVVTKKLIEIFLTSFKLNPFSVSKTFTCTIYCIYAILHICPDAMGLKKFEVNENEVYS